jgi:UDP-2,3-diacylglucosamine pyrophosphatase LpxH
MGKTKRRSLDILVLSDIHLGTYGCHARELDFYLKTVDPKIVVLNGDIVDIWQFRKLYWPKTHMRIIKHIMRWISKGVKVYYIPGNHDEMLRKFVGFRMGSLKIVNKLVLGIDNGKKAWFFHGDVFDITMQHSKWLARLGAVGYDTLILINRFANLISEKILKRGKISFSKRIKNSVKGAIKFINDFEKVAAEIGISNGYDYVVCGHIHQPTIREVSIDGGSIFYLNSGDWIENLTSLEYCKGRWSIYHYDEEDVFSILGKEEEERELNNTELFEELIEEFNLMKTT